VDLLRDRVAFDLGQTHLMLGEYATGEAQLRALLARQVARHGRAHPRPLYTQVALGATLGYQQRSDEAKVLLDEAIRGLSQSLGAQDRKTISARNQLAGIHFRLGEFKLAAAQWMPVYAGFHALTGPASADAVTAQSNIGLALLYSGDAAQSESWLRGALSQARATTGADSPRAQQIRFALADALLDQARVTEVPGLLAGLQPEALARAQQAPDWPSRLAWLQARLQAARGERDAARQSLDAADAGLDRDNPSLRYNIQAVAALRRKL
jgi:hypothetical protein